MTQVFLTSQKLPNHGEYVLAYFPSRPWRDPDAKKEEHKWVVVKFMKGLSIKERNDLPDLDRRKTLYLPMDQDANNLLPYTWDQFGTSKFFGHEASCWCYLPTGLSK